MLTGARPEQRVDAAARHLEAAAAQLEPLLAGKGGADAHEAVGLIMEALMRLNEARHRITETVPTVRATAAE
ncbi:hypothetical protein [Azospirillum sp.]|uniref:hypothetical protein n=1 Tax=Azospirillum sp. TaxID=34012 RepID=UPI002D32D5C4|nr:hypothetical protein [Azospirillum sp.]HYD67793.1 hypothetical protein [Azospirillum sp.]